jgi:hypothetical protein
VARLHIEAAAAVLCLVFAADYTHRITVGGAADKPTCSSSTWKQQQQCCAWCLQQTTRTGSW